MENQEPKYTTPTPEQVSAWEAKHGKLKKVVSKDSETGEEIVFYFKKVDLRVLRLAGGLLQKGDNIAYAETILKNTILNNAELLEDAEIFLSLLPIADKILSGRVASIEKN